MLKFWTVLLFYVGGCTQEYTTKTVPVGDDVTLTCTRRSNLSGFLFWMKSVPGSLPEVLGATYTFDHSTVNKTPHIMTKQEPGTFLLHIKQTQLNDTAFFYCEEVIDLWKSLLNITFLRVKGPEPQTTTIVQELPSLPVHQCSVLSDPANLSCSDHHRIYWFKAGSDDSHPNVLYVHGNSGDKCERIPDAPSAQKCVYDFSWSSISSSDAGTYYCAVATCGQILFGKGTKLEIHAAGSDSVSQRTTTVLLCAALPMSLVLVVLLIYNIQKTKCYCLKAKKDAQLANAKSTPSIIHKIQMAEDTQLYSVVVFAMVKTGSD